MKKLLICVGTRPNFIKITQFKKLASSYNLEIKLLHTGQHFDHLMSNIFFKELNLDEPDIYLKAKGSTQIELMADIMLKFEQELLQYNPDLVLVPGDVNSSLSCAIVASRNNIPVGHIESGLRSFDREMPEEINRILIDDISDYLFATEKSGLNNLINEKKDEKKIHFVGNTMIDSLVSFKNSIDKSNILTKINCDSNYGLMTFHRPSNVDNKQNLEELIKTISLCCNKMDYILPLHPRTKKSLINHQLFEKLKSIKRLTITDSLGYLDFMKLVTNAKLVITDSGGIQEETTYLQIPCLTVRENTERPITISIGTNELVTLESNEIATKAEKALAKTTNSTIPPLWDGKATERILSLISQTI